MNFETLKSQVTQSNFVIDYTMDKFQGHTNVNDQTEFESSHLSEGEQEVRDCFQSLLDIRKQ